MTDQHRVHNRIDAILLHLPRYAFMGRSRLAADAGVSKSAVTRLLNGQSVPSVLVVFRIADALERRIHRSLDPREIVSIDGTYPTPSTCRLMGCRGCLPPSAYDNEDNLKPEYRSSRPGDWSVRPCRNAVTPKETA
jgi:transcriptional regulator with XRE-family HTH domain